MPTPTEPKATSTTGNLVISSINYDGVVPYIESEKYQDIINVGDWDVNVLRWLLNAGDTGKN